MAGKAKAVSSGKQLCDLVTELGTNLELGVEEQVRVGKRLWGAVRHIDVVLKCKSSRVSLGIECKFQGTSGTAEEKIPATIEDIRAWPIRGIVVFAGEGFSHNMRSYLLSTGMAVEFSDLEDWLKLYFAL